MTWQHRRKMNPPLCSLIFVPASVKLFEVTNRYDLTSWPSLFCYSSCQWPQCIDSPQFSTIPSCLLNRLLSKTLFSMSRTVLHFPETDKRGMSIQIISIGIEGMLPVMSGNVHSAAVWLAVGTTFPANQTNDTKENNTMRSYKWTFLLFRNKETCWNPVKSLFRCKFVCRTHLCISNSGLGISTVRYQQK